LDHTYGQCIRTQLALCNLLTSSVISDENLETHRHCSLWIYLSFENLLQETKRPKYDWQDTARHKGYVAPLFEIKKRVADKSKQLAYFMRGGG
jgi:hypothetical protein